MILEPIMEKYFVSASMAYDRDYSIFVRRPISLVILIITVVMVISMMRVNRRVNALNAEQEAAMAAEHEQMGSAEDAVRAVELPRRMLTPPSRIPLPTRSLKRNTSRPNRK